MALIASMVKSADFSYSRWNANVQHGTLPDDVLHPKIWAHVAAQFRAGDEIRVKIESNEWVQYLMVMEVGPSYAVVARIGAVHPLAESGRHIIEADTDFSIEWKGPVRKWAVIRKSDKAVIYEKYESRDAAAVRLGLHVKPKAA